MREPLILQGAVLQSVPFAEADRRLVLLTAARGRITAFAHGARRQNSPLLAVTNALVFGEFSLYEGRSAYTLLSVKPVQTFESLSTVQPGVYYGFYFAELVSHFSQENLEAGGMLQLLYTALRALLAGKIALPLIRRIYECRLLYVNGLFAPPERGAAMDADAAFALRYTCRCPLSALFSFALSETAFADYEKAVSARLSLCLDRPMKSLRVIDELG